jgi:POT family proton-dependent oligopeptide transporter
MHLIYRRAISCQVLKKSPLFFALATTWELTIYFSPLYFFSIWESHPTIIGTGSLQAKCSPLLCELYKVGDSRRDAGFGSFI